MPYESEEQRVSRGSAGGAITSLEADFKLTGSKPFQVFPVSASGTADVITLSVKMPGKATAGDMPFRVGDWSPLLLTEISTASSGVLTDYDLYWSSGDDDDTVDS